MTIFKSAFVIASLLSIVSSCHCHSISTVEGNVPKTAEHHHLEKRIVVLQNHTVPMNSSLRWFMDRLVDLGYYTVGVPRKCRENSVCHAASNFVGSVPDTFIEHWQTKIKNLPIQTLGNHEYTDAWLIGLGSANEPAVCDDIYDCDKTKLEPEDLSVMHRIMSAVWTSTPPSSESSSSNKT